MAVWAETDLQRKKKQCDKGSKHALTVRFQPTFTGNNSDDNVNAVRIRKKTVDCWGILTLPWSRCVFLSNFVRILNETFKIIVRLHSESVYFPREHVCRLLWRHVAAPEVTLPRSAYATFPRKLYISIFKQFSRRRVGHNFRRKLPWHNARVVASSLYGILVQLDLNKLNVSYGRKWRPSSVSAHFLSVSCISKGRRFVASKSHSEISPYQAIESS